MLTFGLRKQFVLTSLTAVVIPPKRLMTARAPITPKTKTTPSHRSMAEELMWNVNKLDAMKVFASVRANWGHRVLTTRVATDWWRDVLAPIEYEDAIEVVKRSAHEGSTEPPTAGMIYHLSRAVQFRRRPLVATVSQSRSRAKWSRPTGPFWSSVCAT